MVVPSFVEQALTGQPISIYGDGNQSRCFCDVQDTVRAIIGLMECPAAVGQVFNVGSANEMTILELAHQILNAVNSSGLGRSSWNGRQGPIEFTPYESVYEEGFEDMRRRLPDIGKIKSIIDWEPCVPFEETLRRIIADHANRLKDQARAQ